jgi:hypothetical protein
MLSITTEGAQIARQFRMKSLIEIEAKINQLAAKIAATKYLLPTFGKTQDSARPHIETDSRGYHYVVVERGEELKRETTQDLDELLFHVLQSITFSLACDYECAHRVRGQDSRRLIFKRQIELLSQLSPAWAQRASRRQEHVLQQHPFND